MELGSDFSPSLLAQAEAGLAKRRALRDRTAAASNSDMASSGSFSKGSKRRGGGKSAEGSTADAVFARIDGSGAGELTSYDDVYGRGPPVNAGDKFRARQQRSNSRRQRSVRKSGGGGSFAAAEFDGSSRSLRSGSKRVLSSIGGDSMRRSRGRGGGGGGGGDGGDLESRGSVRSTGSAGRLSPERPVRSADTKPKRSGSRRATQGARTESADSRSSPRRGRASSGKYADDSDDAYYYDAGDAAGAASAAAAAAAGAAAAVSDSAPSSVDGSPARDDAASAGAGSSGTVPTPPRNETKDGKQVFRLTSRKKLDIKALLSSGSTYATESSSKGGGNDADAYEEGPVREYRNVSKQYLASGRMSPITNPSEGGSTRSGGLLLPDPPASGGTGSGRHGTLPSLPAGADSGGIGGDGSADHLSRPPFALATGGSFSGGMEGIIGPDGEIVAPTAPRRRKKNTSLSAKRRLEREVKALRQRYNQLQLEHLRKQPVVSQEMPSPDRQNVVLEELRKTIKHKEQELLKLTIERVSVLELA